MRYVVMLLMYLGAARCLSGQITAKQSKYRSTGLVYFMLSTRSACARLAVLCNRGGMLWNDKSGKASD
jgi:hypothetical protein